MKLDYRAGDIVEVVAGPGVGLVAPVSTVRVFAADCGYYLRGGEGLYAPQDVQLVSRREGGNPCGTVCDDSQHDAHGICEHCQGVCRCWLYRIDDDATP